MQYISNEQMKDAIPEAIVDNFWNGSSESIELVPSPHDTWTPVEHESLLATATRNSIGPTAIGHSDTTQSSVERTVAQCGFEHQSFLSPMVLYQDLTQKYSSVLEMCESLRYCV
jgi:hypothetical protein